MLPIIIIINVLLGALIVFIVTSQGDDEPDPEDTNDQNNEEDLDGQGFSVHPNGFEMTMPAPAEALTHGRGSDDDMSLSGAEDAAISEDFDMLAGGSGEDGLYDDGGDSLTGESGEDTFSVYRGDANAKPTTIANFDPAQDGLIITHPSGTPVGQNDIEVEVENGNTTIFLNGTPIAVLQGVTGIQADDIEIEHSPSG